MKKWLPIFIVAVIVIGAFAWIMYEPESEVNPDNTITLTNEVFTTDEQGNLLVVYEDYTTVIIPMHESINDNQLGIMEYKFNGPYLRNLRFTVVGEFDDVVLKYKENMDTEERIIDLGKIEDTVVLIQANFPNDNSIVAVEGKVTDSLGEVQNIRFVLDGVSDLSSYEILLFK